MRIRGNKRFTPFKIIINSAMLMLLGLALAGCGYPTPQGGGQIVSLVALVTPTVPPDRLTAEIADTARASITLTPVISPAKTNTPVSTPTDSGTPKPTPTLAVTGDSYVVQSGDTLLGIAIRLKVDYDDLIAANNISDPNAIKVGQKLKLPGRTATGTPTVIPTK